MIDDSKYIAHDFPVHTAAAAGAAAKVVASRRNRLSYTAAMLAGAIHELIKLQT